MASQGKYPPDVIRYNTQEVYCINFLGLIVDGLPRLLSAINTGGFFPDRLLGPILGLPSINLLTSFLPSPKAAPGMFAIRNWIRAWLLMSFA